MDPFKTTSDFLEQFRLGSQKALEAVYRHYRTPLRSFVARGFGFKSNGRRFYFQGLSNESDLEDIIQETFRRAFGARARSAYDGERPYKNYLFTIARNTVITDVTARKRQIPVGDALTRDVPAEELSPFESWVCNSRNLLQAPMVAASDEQLENLEVYGLVMGFTEQLALDEQHFFRVRFLSQCSQESTARHLGWNRARVRKS